MAEEEEEENQNTADKNNNSEQTLREEDGDNRLACSIKKSDKLGKSIAEKLQVFSTTKF